MTSWRSILASVLALALAVAPAVAAASAPSPGHAAVAAMSGDCPDMPGSGDPAKAKEDCAAMACCAVFAHGMPGLVGVSVSLAVEPASRDDKIAATPLRAFSQAPPVRPPLV